MRVQDNHVVSIHYTLTGDNGETIDSSAGSDPLDYIHGQGMIVPGLEKALADKSLGDKFSVTISPEDGYGLRDENLIEEVPREAFQGVPELAVGMTFVSQGPQGQALVTIAELRDSTVIVDGNHAMAGKNLNFAIEVVGVREATATELENGLHEEHQCCGGHCHDGEDGDHECCGDGDHSCGDDCKCK